MKTLNKLILVAVMLLSVSGNAFAEPTPTMTDAEAIKILDAWKAKPKNPYVIYDARHGTNSYDAYMFDKRVRAEAEMTDGEVKEMEAKEKSK